jgi:diadenosine tetraphosphatase ApaH/serine/threonine PP2A family protein phosphatase
VSGDVGYRYLTKASRPFQWEGLGPDERRYLLQLPLTKRITVGGKRYLLVHGTPRDPLDEYLMKDPDAWAKRVRSSGVDIVCVGHSHMQFNLLAGGVLVINPGSVGQPRDGDPRAAYALIDDNRVELKRVAYSVEDTVARVEASAMPERAKAMYAECLRLGRLAGAAARGAE